MELYNKLGVRIVSKREYELLNKSIRYYYNIGEDITYYTPALHLLTNYFKEEKTFNNNFRLLQLIKKKERKNTTGYVFKAKIKTPYRSIYHIDVFIKELPILNVSDTILYYKQLDSKIRLTDPQDKLYYDRLYNNNSPQNIEILVSYLVSKLDENNINPHFCKFFGCIHTVLDKFTYDITDDIDTSDLNKILNNVTENVKYIHTKTRKKEVDEYLEFKNLPVYLLVTEKSDYNLEYLYDNQVLDYNFLKSIVFQIFSAIVVMNNYYGLKHNDLHLQNVMLTLTNETHFYYRYKNKYFKVPTYGYCVKIIDWGRATYNFNGIKGDNSIYDIYSDCFNQYRYPRINNVQKSVILPEEKKWTDIIMVSHNILNSLKDFRDSELGDLLNKNIIDKDGRKIDIEKFDFTTYKEITRADIEIDIEKLFINNLYLDYLTTYNKIPKTNNLYTIIEPDLE